MTEDNSSLLGPIVKAWFARNEWPQSVSEGLARSKGWTCGPWASQVSICMSGRLTPKPNFFRGLGQFNAAVAERDFVGVTDRRLMDRLKNGQPLCHEDGTPWTAQDFFACYIGNLQAPEELRGPPESNLTQELVDEWAQGLREAFRSLVLCSMAPAATVWGEVAAECVRNGISPEEVEWTQEVIAGLREATLDEAKRMQIKYKDQPLIRSLLKVQEKYGGDTRLLKKFLNWRQQLPDPVTPHKLFPAEFEATPKPQRRIGFDPSAVFSGFFAASRNPPAHHLLLPFTCHT